jgi:molybdopterin molybdotransferase
MAAAKGSSMEAYRTALAKLLASIAGPLPKARLDLRAALGHVLAGAVCAPHDSPPFDKALVDGFALCATDTAEAPVRLRVVGEIAAGVEPRARCHPGEAFRIMTGAPLPRGADAVEMVERVRVEGGLVEIASALAAGKNRLVQGAEFRSGEMVLTAGRQLGPAEIGVLASLGQLEIEVFRAPRTTIVSTGNELVDPSADPAPGQIRDSNALVLSLACRRLGVSAREVRIEDDLDRLRAVIREARGQDLLLISGGLSMGEYDFALRALELEGAQVIFHRLPIRPGKPVLGARLRELVVIGLPGNPVSSLVTFNLFARPVIQTLMGRSGPGLPEVVARVEEEIPGSPGRTFFNPAVTRLVPEGFSVRALKTQGSADLAGFSAANSLVVVPAHGAPLAPGDPATVLMLAEDWRQGAPSVPGCASKE